MRASLATNFARPGRPAGFTLVEVMVSVVIATMILGAASTVFITAMNGWEKGGQQEDVLRVARTTGSLIERHLRSAVPPTSDGYRVFDGEVLGDGETPGHRLTMFSSAQGRFPRDLPPTDVCEVEFELDPETGDGMLMRIDATPDDDPYEGGYSIQLSPLIRQFSLTYFDGEEWVEDWYRTSLPKAVELTLAIAYPGQGTSGSGRSNADAPGGESGGMTGGPDNSGALAGPGVGGASDGSERLYHYSRLISLPLGGLPTGSGAEDGLSTGDSATGGTRTDGTQTGGAPMGAGVNQ